MSTLNERIQTLEKQISSLNTIISELASKLEATSPSPRTVTGLTASKASYSPISIDSGLGDIYGGCIIWNTSYLQNTPYGDKPNGTPIKGFNRHSHSRYSGGAVDLNTFEVVEYDIDWDSSTTHDKHCQDYWESDPSIVVVQKTNGENVNKIGTVDFIFNADRAKWGVAAYEINVEKCYLVKRDANGDIETDSNGNEMKSLLYDENNPSKSNIVWDTMAKCWRFFAVYAD